jgi:hypothetical protein
MSYSPIVLILQKTGVADDVLKITPNSQASGFDVVFDQHTINVSNVLYVEQSEITSYIYRFFKSVAMDEDSCEFVQIDCPAYPTVLLTPKKLDNYFPILREQILTLLKGWPAETKLTKKTKKVRSKASSTTTDEPKDTEWQHIHVRPSYRFSHLA